MNESMTLSQFLKLLREDRARWEFALARVPAGQIEALSLPGGWSVKALIGHLTFFEREMVNMLETHSMAGASPWWLLEADDRNQRIFEAVRDRNLSEVRDEAEEVYARLLTLIKALDEADLHDPARFAEMPSDWLPWRILAENTYEHYRDHAEELETWLAVPGRR